MTLPTFVASSASAATTGTAATVLWPTSPAHQADDIGLLVMETQDLAIGVASPSGWTEVTGSPVSQPDASSPTRLTIFWKRATSSAEPNAVTTAPGNHILARILTFRGCETTGNPYEATATALDDVADAAFDIPGATTTVDDCLIVASVTSGSDSGTSSITGWANADLANVIQRASAATALGNGGCFGVATGEKVTAGAYGPTTGAFGIANIKALMSLALIPPQGAPAATSLLWQPHHMQAALVR